MYAYEQALQMGLADDIPTVASTGLPECDADPTWPGFPTAADAAAASDDVPECVPDPTDEIIGVGYPPPHAGYHYAGARTSGTHQGGQVTDEVGDPSVVHDGTTNQFVVARVLAQDGSDEWVEAGWSEVSWRSNVREVYSYNSDAGTWAWPSGYNLVEGHYYKFRATGCSSAICAEIYWSGNWHVIRQNLAGSCGGDSCHLEEFVEVYLALDVTHPSVDAPVDGGGVNFQNTQLKDGGDWSSWTASSSSNPTSPYVVCWSTMYSDFRAGRNLTC